MTEHVAPKPDSVMVLSAAAATGHLRAADALVSAFEARGVSAQHVEVVRYTNPIPGQEERNSDHFLRKEWGFDVITFRPWLIRSILSWRTESGF